MKNLYPLFLFLIAVGLVAFISTNPQPVKSQSSYIEGDAMGLGSEEDAFARITYEWERLRDPQTGKIPAHIRERELAFAATLPNDASLTFAKSTSAVTWQQRGPWNVGGRTRSFGIDVTNENTFISGSCSGGMWRSTDAGQTWAPTLPPGQYKSVSCLVQDTRTGHTNDWYYGTGEAYGASASATGAYYLGYGIYKSTDNGLTWNSLPSTIPGNLVIFDTWGDIIWDMAIDPSNSSQDEVYAAAYGGIYKSLNGGTSWTQAKGDALGAPDSYFTDVEVSPTGVVYCSLSSDGPQKGIWRSTDGITFTDITPPNFPTTYNRIKIGISPSDENQVWFVGNTPGFGQPDTNFLGTVEWNSLWKYTYLSGSGAGTGGAWSDRSVNLPTTGGLFDKFQSQGSYDLVMKVKSNDTNTVFIGGTNLYRSTSGFTDDVNTTFIGGYVPGATLPVVNSYPDHHPDQHELVFLPSNPDVMYSINDGGIFRTNDNTASNVVWNSLNNGYLTSMFYTCAIDHAATNDIVIGGAQDNGSWYTNSAQLTVPWVTPRSGDGSYCAIADNQTAYYFSIQNGKMMKAKLDPSGNVDSFARIDPLGGTGYQFINPYIIDPNNNNLMYLAGGKYLWRNDDLSGIPYASNWDSITTNWVQWPDSVPTANAKITCLAASKVPANRLYYGTSNRRLYRVDNANTGTPLATDITAVAGSVLFPAGANISCVAVDPTNADNIMVTFSNYSVYSIFYSNDGGVSWTKQAGNLEQNSAGSGNGPSVRWASIMPVNGGTVYLAGTSTGLYATTQLNGLNTVWIQQGANNIGSSVCDMIDYRSTDGLVVVATHSHGIFSTHINDVNDITSVQQLSSPVVNFTNYPNPFSKQTTIEFNLLKPSHIKAVILDETGKEVFVLADKKFNTGKNNLAFQSVALAKGVYYCNLRSDDFTETRKLMYLQ